MKDKTNAVETQTKKLKDLHADADKDEERAVLAEKAIDCFKDISASEREKYRRSDCINGFYLI